jgi:shikimate kinase
VNVALFGFMGVGKSVIGRILAEKLCLTFVDLDEEIVKSTGKAIVNIFEEEGEDVFRDVEREVTREIAARDRQVIACGGGTVLDDENLRRLRCNSMMILLTAEPETILERVKGDTRPLLMVGDRLECIRGFLSTRHPQYVRAADLVVGTSGKTPVQVADEILSCLREAYAT